MLNPYQPPSQSVGERTSFLIHAVIVFSSLFVFGCSIISSFCAFYILFFSEVGLYLLGDNEAFQLLAAFGMAAVFSVALAFASWWAQRSGSIPSLLLAVFASLSAWTILLGCFASINLSENRIEFFPRAEVVLAPAHYVVLFFACVVFMLASVGLLQYLYLRKMKIVYLLLPVECVSFAFLAIFMLYRTT